MARVINIPEEKSVRYRKFVKAVKEGEYYGAGLHYEAESLDGQSVISRFLTGDSGVPISFRKNYLEIDSDNVSELRSITSRLGAMCGIKLNDVGPAEQAVA